jgi:hypothetical protein
MLSVLVLRYVGGASCIPFSRERCRNVSIANGLQLGGADYKFTGGYSTKGCYAYSTGKYKGMSFFGTGGSLEQMKASVRSPKYRPTGYDACSSNPDGAIRCRAGTKTKYTEIVSTHGHDREVWAEFCGDSAVVAFLGETDHALWWDPESEWWWCRMNSHPSRLMDFLFCRLGETIILHQRIRGGSSIVANGAAVARNFTYMLKQLTPRMRDTKRYDYEEHIFILVVKAEGLSPKDLGDVPSIDGFATDIMFTSVPVPIVNQSHCGTLSDHPQFQVCSPLDEERCSPAITSMSTSTASTAPISSTRRGAALCVTAMIFLTIPYAYQIFV